MALNLSIICGLQHIVINPSAKINTFLLKSEPESPRHAIIAWNYLPKFKPTKLSNLTCYLAKYLP